MDTKTFLSSKLENFKRFCQDRLPAKLERFRSEVNSLTVEQLVLFTTVVLAPYRNDLMGYLNQMLSTYEVPKSEISNEDYRKMYRYLSCFCETVLH